MTQSIAALPPTPLRDSDAPPRVFEHDSLEQPKFWSSDDGASFDDALDTVNPLHHIPVVSAIYRAVSGDTIGFGPRLIGAAIFGGPLGLIIAGITALFEEVSGGGITDHAVALFEDLTGDGENAPASDLAGGAETRPLTAMRIEASALAEAPAALAMIAETPLGARPSGEIPAVAAAIARGAMIAAVARPNVASVRNTAMTPEDSDSKRIAQTLLQAQRAQAHLLLANLRAFDQVKSRPHAEDDRHDDKDREPHSNLLPAGARPMWYADAMQRALDKYQTQSASSTGAP